jgi:hypothetical protein
MRSRNRIENPVSSQRKSSRMRYSAMIRDGRRNRKVCSSSGVVRDRLAEAEDRLFATVFLGSGLLFLAMMFVAGAVFAAVVAVHVARPEVLVNSPAFALARAFAYSIVNVYAIKMASVFMLITSTLALRTAFVARWMAAPGLVVALFLLFVSQWVDWSLILFPAWALLVSVYILFTNFHRTPAQ